MGYKYYLRLKGSNNYTQGKVYKVSKTGFTITDKGHPNSVTEVFKYWREVNLHTKITSYTYRGNTTSRFTWGNTYFRVYENKIRILITDEGKDYQVGTDRLSAAFDPGKSLTSKERLAEHSKDKEDLPIAQGLICGGLIGKTFNEFEYPYYQKKIMQHICDAYIIPPKLLLGFDPGRGDRINKSEYFRRLYGGVWTAQLDATVNYKRKDLFNAWGLWNSAMDTQVKNNSANTTTGTKKMSTLTIETVTQINSRNADDHSDDALIDLIRQQRMEMADLVALDSSSKSIEGRVSKCRENIKKLEGILDARLAPED